MPNDWKNEHLSEMLYDSASDPTVFDRLGYLGRYPKPLTRLQRLRVWWDWNVGWRFARRPPWDEG